MQHFLLGVAALGSAFLIIYHHLMYPLVLRFFEKRDNRSPTISPRCYTSCSNDAALPYITLVMPAYNEEAYIADKICNLATLDYPSARFNIIIACDGCTDNTVAIAKRCAQLPECRHLNIDIRNFSRNRGKVALINQVVSSVHCDLVALSDVSALISVDALLVAAEQFKNRKIGVLNGHYRLLNPGSTGESAYWQYQSRLKTSEAALGSTMGAHGAFYVFRRNLFSALAPDTINDDFILPMAIVAKGYHCALDKRITALELEQSDDRLDQQRRIRISAGNVQQLLRLKHLLLPKHGAVAFMFMSGKGLRVLMPFIMLMALFCSALLANDSWLFLLLTWVQVFLYALATLQLAVKPKHPNRISQTLAYIVGGHFSNLIGSVSYLFNRKKWTDKHTFHHSTMTQEV